MSEAPTHAQFYSERVPAQFNRTLLAAEEAAGSDDPLAVRVFEGMKAVNATIRVIVSDPAGDATYELNIKEGQAACEPAAANPPFMILKHGLNAFEALERESGDSILGFLGGLAGLGEDMKLTSQRIRNLAGLDGTMLFELTGEGGFLLHVHFGESAMSVEPKCSIRIEIDAYRKLQTGELNPQDGFMSGQIALEGDMQMGMQLALAALSPD